MNKQPKKLDIRVDLREYCHMFEIFLDDKPVHACIVADAEKGLILRFKRAIGNKPVRSMNGKYLTETLRGKVEIRFKGEAVEST